MPRPSPDFRKFATCTFVLLLATNVGANATVRRMFTTSTVCAGSLGACSAVSGDSGLEAGNNVCQEAAVAAGIDLGGAAIFRAWLSDSTTDAYCNVQGLSGKRTDDPPCGGGTLVGGGPWVRMDGTPFAHSLAMMVDQLVVLTPPLVREDGTDITFVPFQTFTATSPSGTLLEGPAAQTSCLDWTSVDPSHFATVGSTTDTLDRWTESTAFVPCNITHRLLCFEQGPGDRIAFAEPAAALAFVTTASGNANLSTWLDDPTPPTGRDAGDAICQRAAAAAGLPFPESFLAWLSTSAVDARSRFSASLGLKRVDGIPIAANLADLLDQRLETSISMTELSTYTNAFTFTGTHFDGTRLASSVCGNWTNNSDFSQRGSTTTRSNKWTTGGSATCAAQSRIYCFGTEEILFADGFEWGNDLRWSAAVGGE